MDAKDYESTEFYSYKFKNFSTMIIVPAALLVFLMFIGSFAIRQSTVSSVGVIEPVTVIKQKLLIMMKAKLSQNMGKNG